MIAKKPSLDLNNFEKLESIGKGGFSEVFKVRDKNTSKFYAAKILLRKLIENTKNFKARFLYEVNINLQMSHPTILAFIGYCPNDFYHKPKPVIITEYLPNGSLHNLLQLDRHNQQLPFWDDTMKLICIFGIATGMRYLHSNDITHLDLKPGNILIDDYLFPKICDFGLSKVIRQNQINENSITSPVTLGTPKYIAPEVYKKSLYTKSADVYAFAIIVYQIITKIEPYKGFDDFEVFEKVMSKNYRPEFTDSIPEAYKRLIERCWSNDPNDRPTFDEIVEELKNNTEFITENVDSEKFKEFIDYIENDSQITELKHFNKISIDEELKKMNRIEELSSFEHFDLNNFEGFSELCEETQNFLSESISNSNIQSKQITITSKETNLLYSNHSLSSPGMLNVLSFFEDIEFEIEFPSNYFESIYNTIFDIKKEKLSNINIKFMVTTIASIKRDLFVKYNSMNKISIPSSTTSIEKNAFKGCSFLINVTIPSSVTSIGEGAFSECSSLLELEIPSSVTSIGPCAFKGCTSITKITVPNSISLFEKSLFYDCKSLDNFTIPFSVKSICEYSFYNCSSLSKLFIPFSVKSIGEFAFSGCKSLKKLTDHSTTTVIKRNAFYGCSSLMSIEIPATILEIEDEAFSECSSAAEIKLPFSLASIGNNVFKNCSSLAFISLPSSINKIGNEVFFGCSSLSEVVINSNISFVSDGFFKECKNLTKVSFSSSIKTIGKEVFQDCSSLKEISIPSSVILIDEKAFSRCTSLQRISFPFTIEEINSSAFDECYTLEESETPSDIILADQKYFCNLTSFTQLNIYSNYTNDFYSNGLFGMKTCLEILNLFESISITINCPSENFKAILNLISKFKREDISQIKIVLLFTGIKKISDFYDINNYIDEIQIDPSVESIGCEAFRDFLSLTKITIPYSVTSIGEKAFKNCSSLKEITIPSSVTFIGWGTFIECSSLTEIKIPSSIKLIPEYMFYKCTSLSKVFIPFSVTKIDKFAFFGCKSLLKLSIPSSVNHFGDSAFDQNTKLLRKSKPKKKISKKSQQNNQNQDTEIDV